MINMVNYLPTPKLEPPMLFALIFILFSQAGMAQSSDLYSLCQQKVRSGNYGERKYELLCKDHFQMPEPYMFRCMDWLKNGTFPTPADKTACRFFCESNKNWGPWYDFEIPYDLRTLFFRMRGLSRGNQCFIDQCPDFSGNYQNAAGEKKEVQVQKDQEGIFSLYQISGLPQIKANGETTKLEAPKTYRAYCSMKWLKIEFHQGGALEKTLTYQISGDTLEEIDSTKGNTTWKKIP
jgi:hypothetical protein